MDQIRYLGVNKKAAVAEVVESAPSQHKKDLAEEARGNLPATEEAELAQQFRPSPEVADEIWLTIVRAI